MLSENIKTIRKSKGLSQEELAVKVNVVRQTISKWEQGLSVPDADLLLALSEALDTPASVLLGETVSEARADELRVISEKLEIINLQLAQRKESRRKAVRILCATLLAITLLTFAAIATMGSPYLGWDYSDPETAVVGVALHAFEWIFIRVAPLAAIVALAGIILTRRK
ncbi:MAG: helix-turn-helix transcriptional regulator [Eggerthellaceae bacterium]|nr:helix-turn-helix transcriptional regulator [Eggerthellaceae bacterium]